MKNIKLIKIYFLFVLAIILLINNVNAQNLVPNPSFEEYSECPDEPGQTNLISSWTININTVDYFNECGIEDFSVPSNFYGNIQNFDTLCKAYAGLWAYKAVSPGYQEYIGTQLLSPLLKDEKYYVSFKISLANREFINCAVNGLGVLFTNENYGFTIINYPQIMTNNYAHIYTSEPVIDNANWTILRGSFTADSIYSYIILGKFFDNDNSIITCGESSYSDRSYYYIDDVCVSTDSVFCWDYVCDCNGTINYEIKNKPEYTLYPNPASNYVYIQMENEMFNKSKSVALYTLQGENVTDKVGILENGSNGITIKRNQLDAGVYVIRIQTLNNFYNAKLIFINNF